MIDVVFFFFTRSTHNDQVKRRDTHTVHYFMLNQELFISKTQWLEE